MYLSSVGKIAILHWPIRYPHPTPSRQASPQSFQNPIRPIVRAYRRSIERLQPTLPTRRLRTADHGDVDHRGTGYRMLAHAGGGRSDSYGESTARGAEAQGQKAENQTKDLATSVETRMETTRNPMQTVNVYVPMLLPTVETAEPAHINKLVIKEARVNTAYRSVCPKHAATSLWNITDSGPTSFGP